MSEAIVSLPMYDWPEVQIYNDRFFKELRTSLADQGFIAPTALNRTIATMDQWLGDNLLLSQTCGLPFKTVLKDKVSLVGTPAYGINCGAGSYFSVIVVHQDTSIDTLDDLKGLTFTYNDKRSQSGYAALLFTLSHIGNTKDFRSSFESGSHRASIQTVAAGRADFASIDALSWELALRHEPAAQKLKVIATSEPTPTLPFITARRSRKEIDQLHMAVVDAMVSLDEETREALLLIGFSPLKERDYDVIETRLNIVKRTFGMSCEI
ncbi:phosphate/phosphite/phosphonate ABC transporter substrate-binding protein [Kiloniella sp. EL199]|uniref:phosphate/phosphite/phosphonate ABC transporter substrate-binding protein n=1 Tax=Kiloniella sp. EL199 TaxID=2107581 RepID=UPI000EA28ADA|nr:PhnD/SsuA/transferrin family substrate-binding protein [Kiloniella sp. EL199]